MQPVITITTFSSHLLHKVKVELECIFHMILVAELALLPSYHVGHVVALPTTIMIHLQV